MSAIFTSRLLLGALSRRLDSSTSTPTSPLTERSPMLDVPLPTIFAPRSGAGIRIDLTERAVVLPGTEPWVPSPAAGIERMRLERFGENARATSLVRYAP